ncbi:MAG TPA: DUF928 domain-containing protein [Stenomitos sp.]
MTKMTLRLDRMTLACAMALAFLTSYSQRGDSQPPEVNTNKLNGVPLIYNAPPPPDQGAPGGRSRGGSGRGPCQNYQSLTPLVPVTKGTTKDFVWGLTASEHPTFWFDVPERLTAQVPVEFVLLDTVGNYVYQKKLTVPETSAGIVKFSVPSTAPALEVGKRYDWIFSIYCDPESSSAAISVRGSVQRVALDSALDSQLKAAKTPVERAALYANQGIWHEALTTLGEQLSGTKPKDSGMVAPSRSTEGIAAAWANLLKQVNLGNSASDPIVPCCTAEQSTTNKANTKSAK